MASARTSCKAIVASLPKPTTLPCASIHRRVKRRQIAPGSPSLASIPTAKRRNLARRDTHSFSAITAASSTKQADGSLIPMAGASPSRMAVGLVGSVWWARVPLKAFPSGRSNAYASSSVQTDTTRNLWSRQSGGWSMFLQASR